MRPKDTDPSAGQTLDEIREYYANAKVGDPACVRSTYGGILNFRISTIEMAAAKSRIALAHRADYGGYGFYVDGRNCKSPGGQARLVRPSDEIAEWIQAHPVGSMHWR